MSNSIQNTRFLPSQDSIEIQIKDDGTLILSQIIKDYETQIIRVSPLYVDEFINQLKLTIAGE